MIARWISSVVHIIRDEMVAEGFADDYEGINRGNCDEFADRLVRRIEEESSEGDTPQIDALEINDFFLGAAEFGGPLDREKLGRMLPEMVPPGGMTWDALDRIVFDADMGWGLHVFTVCEGRVYDSEVPDGVESFFDLPFYVRYLDRLSVGNSPVPVTPAL